MPRRRKRVLTPELRRRIRLRRKLDDLDISLADLARRSGIDRSIFSRFLLNDIEESGAEKVILEAIEKGQKRAKASPAGRLTYV